MSPAKFASQPDDPGHVSATLWKGAVLTACVLGGCLVLIGMLAIF